MLVDTNYGVKCPLKTGLYEKLDSKTNSLHKALLLQQDSSQQKLYPTQQQPPQQQQQEPCKYLTQTQTLQVGCQNEQQYSLRTKLCYPNQQSKHEELVAGNQNVAGAPQDSIKNTAYTQLESEINLVCLAHWRHDGNQVIVSRTMSNEILCSVSS